MSARGLTTLEVVAFKRLGRTIDNRWVGWAVSMLERGFDSKSMRILAGENATFNQFEMEALLRNVFIEQGLVEFSSKDAAARALASAIASSALDGSVSLQKALVELNSLCIEHGYADFLFDFYLLHHELCDAQEDEMGRYWPGATRANIEELVRERLQAWLAENSGCHAMGSSE